MNAQFFYEMGRLRKFKALIPVFNTDYFRVMFSTRSGNIEIFKGDGSSGIPFSPAKMVDATINSAGISQALLNYDALFTGNVEVNFLKGKNDVYSFMLQRNAGSQSENLNISNFGNFISQFPNLYSYLINIYGGVSIINGNFLQLPPSVERLQLYYSQISGSPTIDFDGIPINSNLKWIQKTRIGINTVTVKGDLAKLPLNCNHVNIEDAEIGSSISYSGGKTWASLFDTLMLYYPLKRSLNNSLLSDLATSVTSAVGGKLISNLGFRTASSDLAFSTLNTLGYTISIPTISDKVILSLSSNYNDTSGNSNNAIATGSPIFDSGALKTSTNNFATVADNDSLDMGSSSFEFGCDFKINSYTGGLIGIIGKTIFGSTAGRYGLYISSNMLTVIAHIGVAISISTDVSLVNDGNWHNARVTLNRVNGYLSLVIDDVLVAKGTFNPNSTNYNTSGKFFIGAYGNATGTDKQANTEFDGWIKNVFFSKT